MITEEGKYYLYRHIRLDTNEVFYIGIGTKNLKLNTFKGIYKRAFVKKGKNLIWKRIVNKTHYRVEIILESDDYEFIKQKEIEFISLYGRKDLKTGILSNRTKGGEFLNEEAIKKSHKANQKCVYQFNKSGQLIKKWDSIIEASKSLNTNPALISHIAIKNKTGTNWTHKTFIWRFNDKLGVHPGKNYKVGKDSPNSKKVYQYNLNGELVKEWSCVIEVQNELKINAKRIYDSCNHDSIAYNHKWFYEFKGLKIEPFKKKKIQNYGRPILKIDPRTKEVIKEYRSTTEAVEKELGLFNPTLYALIRRVSLGESNMLPLGFDWKVKK